MLPLNVEVNNLAPKATSSSLLYSQMSRYLFVHLKFTASEEMYREVSFHDITLIVILIRMTCWLHKMRSLALCNQFWNSSELKSLLLVRVSIILCCVHYLTYNSTFCTRELDEVVRRANSTRYGLAAGVFTKNIDTANTLTRALRAGTVWVNCFDVFDAAIPFGGYKMSGIGREKGIYSLHNYLQVKAVVTPLKNPSWL